MKIQINLPEQLTENSQEISKKLRLSFDEFLATVLITYLNSHQGETTAKLNEICQTEKSSLDPLMSAMQSRSLGTNTW